MAASHPRQSSVDLDSPDRPFDNIINFRDVGRSINRLLGRPVLKEGILFRSARLDDASERDKRRITDELHISTVIDLRSSTEHQMATTKRRAELGDDSPAFTPAVQHLVDLPGVRRELISLTGKAFERTLLWKLDWWHFIKVLALAASGYRPDAVLIVGEQVMTPRGLIGLGQDTLDSSTAEMRAIFDLFAPDDDDDGDGEKDREIRPSTYPILVHCTQGKDRTGLVILLLLLLAGRVAEDAMRSDYVRSEPELLVEVEERMKEIRLLGLSEDYTKCPAGFTTKIRGHLDEKYGGVEGYLRYVGVNEEKLERIRQTLLA
ncbi:putative tyrosine/serine protein phosphatase [Aspergillus steynii IBT 23096]|uniref:Putative tyrosine/serine protein phosphatase n=1 Tax=Aspergillus steynii IBT 23096 TaxID=1392250 RepID=A0A2I2G265_9EURO|nr:putative tyrosine/serine protein phosphatase [Aspergillus steynii IBT 23096]PLB46968.1 putative tyrosine/serine protein phosphatase [Aspergillus steynii IBT 23096]